MLKNKQLLKSALDFIGGFLWMTTIAILTWLFLVITPDQSSAECEAIREEMQAE